MAEPEINLNNDDGSHKELEDGLDIKVEDIKKEQNNTPNNLDHEEDEENSAGKDQLFVNSGDTTDKDSKDETEKTALDDTSIVSDGVDTSVVSDSVDGISFTGNYNLSNSLTNTDTKLKYKEQSLDNNETSHFHRRNNARQGHVNKTFVNDEASEPEDKSDDENDARQEVNTNDEKRDSDSDDCSEKDANELQGNGITHVFDTLAGDNENADDIIKDQTAAMNPVYKINGGFGENGAVTVKPAVRREMSETSTYSVGNEFIQDEDEIKIALPDSESTKSDSGSENNDDDGYNYEDEDIWALPEFTTDEKKWSSLTRNEKIKKVLWHYIGKGILLIFLLYIFICSLSFLGDAFKLLGGKAAGKTFTNVDILSNRLAGVIIGILATVLLQSSSTTTSIVVSMVGSGSLLTVRQAIPIIMGANIGTTITNTIVAIGQINHRDDFRRAFAGATVHDVFNWVNVLVMLLLEEIFGYLEALTGAIVKNFEPGESSGSDNDYLKALTDPFTKLIIQIDKKIITRIATGNITGDDQSIIKHKCGDSRCKFMFEHISSEDGGGWSDGVIGVLLLLIALFLLCVCLVGIVKILHSLLKGQIAKWIRKFINANLPGKFAYFTGYIALLIGAGITILVQSSSIFTSSLTPLVGMGVLSLDRMYPLTLGSNIGTTGTSIIAAFAQDPAQMKDALQIALCHLFFNITGILIFYPIPMMRFPINAAKFLGIRSSKYRWFAILYIIFPFFVFPALGLGLSLIHVALLITVLVLVAVVIIVIIVIKFFQRRFPRFLPEKFRTWKWLPEWMRSLEPTDRLLQRIWKRIRQLKLFMYCRKYCRCKAFSNNESGVV